MTRLRPHGLLPRSALATLGAIVAGAATVAAQPPADLNGLGCTTSRVPCIATTVAAGRSGAIYAAGEAVDLIGGMVAPTTAVARWDPGTQRWSTLAGARGCGVFNGTVFAIAEDRHGNVYAGGLFSAVDGVPAMSIARWSAAEQTWQGLGCEEGKRCGVDGTVASLIVDEVDNLFIGGRFSNVVTTPGDLEIMIPVRNIARWDGQSWSGLDGGIECTSVDCSAARINVFAMALVGINDVYVGGAFNLAGGDLALNIVRWRDGFWEPLLFVDAGMATHNGLAGPVMALALSPDGSLYAGGEFLKPQFNNNFGPDLHHLARWLPGTRVWQSLGEQNVSFEGSGARGGTQGMVQALAVDDGGTVYVGGDLTSVNSTSGPGLPTDPTIQIPVRHIASWNPAAPTSWGALQGGMDAPGSVFGVAAAGAGVYATGRFVEAGGEKANRIARWDGTAWSPLIHTEARNRVVALEAIQTVQSWDNSVPLVKGKPTLARIHVETTGTSRRFTGKLHGYRDGLEFANSPLVGDVVARGAAAERRGDLDASLNFMLPKTWLEDELQLRLDPEGDFDCSIPLVVGGVLARPCLCSVNLELEDPIELDVRFMRHTWRDQAGMFHEVPPDVVQPLFDRLVAALPVTKETAKLSTGAFTWHAPNNATPDVDDLVPVLEHLRTKDGCTNLTGCRTIYYGLTKVPRPESTRRRGAALLPGNRAASLLPPSAFSNLRNTHVHEIGHVLGREHTLHSDVPVSAEDRLHRVKRGYCGEEGFADEPNFPFHMDAGLTPDSDSGRVFTLGQMEAGSGARLDPGHPSVTFGLDMSENPPLVVDPEEHGALMGYCRDLGTGVREWVWTDRHTFTQLLAKRCPGDPGRLPPCPVEDEGAGGGGGLRRFLLVRGEVEIGTNSAVFYPFGSIDSPAPPFPPAAGDYVLELVDGDGFVLEAASFSPVVAVSDPPSDRPVGTFLLSIEPPAGTRLVRLRFNGRTLASRAVSGEVPQVQVLAPNGGEVMGDAVAISWIGSDGDGDDLTYAVEYSRDGGATFETLAVDYREQQLEVPRTALGGTAAGLIRVEASDGYHTSSDTSDAPFRVGNQAPRVTVAAPAQNALFQGEATVMLDGSATDVEDGSIPDVALEWRSDRDGVLGQGGELVRGAADLSEGTHVLTLTARDTAGDEGSASVSVQLYRDAPSLQPIARAGGDRTVAPGERVILDGSASEDPDGDSLTFEWRQIGGPAAALENATSALAALTAPGDLAVDAGLLFELVVRDAALASVPDRVEVAVLVPPTCPGDCGGDGAVTIDDLVLGVRVLRGEGLALCEAVDAGGDGAADVDEMREAVVRALRGCEDGAAAVTPTPRPTPTATPTPGGASPTPTLTRTPAPSATQSPSRTATPPATPSPSSTATAVATPTPSATQTWTPTATATLPPTATRTFTPNPTVTPTRTRTRTPTVTSTFTATPQPTPTRPCQGQPCGGSCTITCPDGMPSASGNCQLALGSCTCLASCIRTPTPSCRGAVCGGPCTLTCPDGMPSSSGTCQTGIGGCTCIASCIRTPGPCNPAMCGGPCLFNCPNGPITGTCSSSPGGGCVCLGLCPL